MTIKSDKWIRRMAEEHGMISPFEPEMIREKEGKKKLYLSEHQVMGMILDALQNLEFLRI
jgi:deoxycytidine triphosphate deaminase